MKGLKRFFKIIIFMVIITMIPLAGIANVDTSSNETINLGIDKFRGKDSDNTYPAYALTEQYLYKLYQIKDNNEKDYNAPIYCVDAVRGVNPGGNITGYNKVYNTKYNMMDVSSKNSVISDRIGSNGISSENYEKIVRLLENMYIQGTTNKKQFLEKMLGKTGEFTNGNENQYQTVNDWYYITDKDIELAQQLAIWHFTNYNNFGEYLGDTLSINDLFITIYSDENKTSVDNIITRFNNNLSPSGNLNNPNFYKLDQLCSAYSIEHQFGDLNETEEEHVPNKYLGMWNKDDAIKNIYKKLVEIANDDTITISNTEKPLEMSNIFPTQEIKNGKYIIGPFKIERYNDNYEIDDNDINLEDSYGSDLENYNLLIKNENDEMVQTNETLKQLIGKEFYVELNENTLTKSVRFKFQATYNKMNLNYWTNVNDANTQPAVMIKNEPEDILGDKVITLIKPSTGVKVKKEWKKDVQENRPVSIDVKLKKDDVEVENSIKHLSEDNNWEATWENLDKYDANGEVIDYTVEEVNVPEGYVPTIKKEDNNEITLTNTLIENKFDLALRKFITTIDEKDYTDKSTQDYRVPEITQEEIGKLVDGEATFNEGNTAKKSHSKQPLPVHKGSKVVYTIRVYNEGKVAGTANKVVDYLPEGLSLASESAINESYGWSEPDENGKVETSILATKTINPPKKGVEGDSEDNNEIYYEDLLIECVVNENATNRNLKNIAAITEYSEEDDIDSEPKQINTNTYNPKNPEEGLGEEDDDDFEIVALKEYDFSLRKFVSAVGSKEITDRVPNVINNNLIPNGTEETAIYKGTKNPVGVNVGEIVTYTIRVYNEGEQDGYVGEISDYLPEELDFIGTEDLENAEDIATAIDNLDAIMDGNTENVAPENKEKTEAMAFNAGYGWKYDKQTRKIYTNILSKNPNTLLDSDAPDYTTCQNTIIEKAKTRRGEDSTILLKKFNGEKIDYLDVQVKCRVNSKAKSGQRIVNIAEISKYEDENGNELLEDRDSEPRNFPENKKNNEYEGNGEIDGYYPGQQDDDDFEALIIEQFDLALRKFISNVEGKDITDRIPSPDTSKLNTKDDKGNLITNVEYNHLKVPVTVVKGNKITYTIRVYNEGDVDGYATEITDYLPPELEYVKDSEINEQYKWEFSKDGRTATTDYLSYSKGDKNLIKAYDGEELDYKEVKIQCRVKDTSEYERNITNLAQITDDSDLNGNDVEDRDSHPNDKFVLPDDKDLPKYKDDEISKLFVPGQEEDDDFEKVNVVYFDLALRKIVSKAIIIENNGETITETNHKFEDDPEEIVKVDLGKRKLNAVTVKFEYQIRITNEGLIEGYAKEVKDYIPEGLVFKAEDNPLWKEIESGVITTDQLKDTLLKPGESKVISVLLTWKNGQDNLGLKVNTAEISKDYNKFNTPDIDSTPDNKKDGEDDIDTAPVMLSIALGNAKTYFGLSILMLSTTAIGIVLIKKFVL